MKNLILQTSLILTLAGALSMVPAKGAPVAVYSYAIPTQADNADITAGNADDLILNTASSLTSSSYVSSFGESYNADYIVNGNATNDGAADGGNGLSGDEYTAQGFVTYTFDLNTNTDPTKGPVGSADGYTITGFDLYSGYNGGFQQQNFTVLVKTTGSDGQFISLGNYQNYAATELFTNPNDPATGYYNQVNSTVVTDTTGALATNVIAVEFQNFGVVTKEFQVLGEPSLVPEPATWAMLLGGLGFLGFWLRRRLV